MTATAHRPGALLRRPLAVALGVLGATAVLGWLAVLAVPSLGHGLYPHAPRPALPSGPGTALELVVHNAPVALWPLALIALDWHEIPVAQRVGDGLVAAQLAIHGATIGAALGTWPEVIRWLPHLPAEWAAIAIPCATWIAARRRGVVSRRSLLGAAAVSVALLALAAALETWGTP